MLSLYLGAFEYQKKLIFSLDFFHQRICLLE